MQRVQPVSALYVTIIATTFMLAAPAMGNEKTEPVQPSFAATPPKFPQLTGRVIDEAKLLSEDDERELVANLKALEDKNSDQVVVVTLPSLQGHNIEDYAQQLGNYWGIGTKAKNNGVLLIVAPNERKVRIEVGLGLETILTDKIAKSIMDIDIVPRIREGNYAAGIKDGVNAIFVVLSEQPASERASVVLDTLTYDGKQFASLRYGDLILEADSEPSKDDPQSRVPYVVGRYKGQQVFGLHVEGSGREEPAADVSVMRLDPGTSLPQIVLAYYWGGAHCCTVTKIATTDTAGNWRVLDGGALDGDGYEFKDLDGDGGAELLSVDNSFLYAFASYAESYAPTRITKLINVELRDVTHEVRYEQFLRTRLKEIEAAARSNNFEGSNGYLGGWVAQKALVGELDDAWRKMLNSYDHNSDWTLEECVTGAPLDSCPDDKKRKIAFPTALSKHLFENHYITADQKRTLTSADQTTDWPQDPSGLMQMCVESSPTVKELILDEFVRNRLVVKVLGGIVVLSDDFTVNDHDSSLNKVTCAVTYEVSLKRMIGLLVENRQMRIANRLSALARRTGSTVSHRVTYTVQPTSKPGQTWVQLHP